MSTTTAATPNSPAKTRKDREREKEKEKALLAAERLKTVVRRLPPNLPEDVFWKSVEPWVSEETVSWKIYYKGKFRSRLNKENMPSRAYIAFKNPEQIAVFSQSYDGHMFRDKAGNESYAVVEYAPYQKVPMEKKKADARNATIENDEDYISFLATLKATAEPVSLETLIASSQPAPQPKTTPLLEALKAEKSASKDKEAILRNHAHYKEHPRTLAGQAARAKEEAKKKGSALPNKPAESGPSGKKPKKPANTNGNANATTPNGVKAPAPAPGGAGSSKPKPARAPRAARVQHAKPGGSTPTSTITPTILTPAAAPTPAVATPVAAAPPNVSTAPPSATTPAATDAQPPTGPRRGRPVIGIASRHFEAALSGAGVRGSAAAGRGPRPGAETQTDGDSGANGADSARKEPPTSPRRERRRREGGGAAGGQGGGPPGAATTEAPKVPSILQRVDASPAVANVASGDAPAPVQGQAPTQGGGRGGRRGRGRGRGGAVARGG